uniref:MATH domain-containing protein n=1 Tax=Davidia involucrata TaxID=16924 RepID=A0A5B7ADG4_DAVIN
MDSCKRKREPEDTTPVNNGAVDVSRSLREVQPAHYLFKIESFSILLETNIEEFESDDFEAGGYKWKLRFYPNGNKKRNVNGHISLYLVISDTKTLPRGWEVNIQFKLFVFDHIRDKYLTVQDGDGSIRRFHGMKTEWGFDQLLSLDTFKDASNGYFLDDSCVFGAEVFVIKYAGRGECLSMIKQPNGNIYTWKVRNFAAVSNESLYSEEFITGERKWKLMVYPKGNANEKGKSLSLFLGVADCATLPLNWKLYAQYKLRIKDQVNSKHLEKQASHWFTASMIDWGYSSFMLLSDLNDKSRGFIVDNTLIVEVEISVMSVIKNFT